MRQQTLFDLGEPSFTNRTAKAVTFRGKLSLPIHRWYRLTPSFSPRLADDIADYFALTNRDLVLDPFSGVGTVPLCMKHRGIPACSVEINPYLHFVATVKTRTYADLSGLERYLSDFLAEYRAALQAVPYQTRPDRYLLEEAAYIPKINFPERWWSSGNLAQLVCLRKLLLSRTADGPFFDLLRLGALAILVPVSNAKHNHVSLTFAESPLPTVDVAQVLAEQFANMTVDLRAVADKPQSDVTVFRGNSKELSRVLPRSYRRVTAVITSPPYPNRFSYARETRPHLFYLNFIESASAVGQLETDAIGGTWGKATSVLTAGVEPKNDVVKKLLTPHLKAIPEKGQLMAAYVVKYFNDLYDHAEEVAKVCAPKCRLAYVIGNSKFFNNPLPSDELLAAVFEHFGFTLDRIDRMRKRQSKSGLHEAVVFLQRGLS
ncbi:MAG: hypothetical protein JNM56_04845 [Planctomycetia bacterium]|nr:hypothetical protein [Planctomycetia bacterium]